MVEEIDLRPLIHGNLKCEEYDVRAFSLVNDNTINLQERSFEINKKWNRKEQTSYIESIFLNCCLQPIIRYKNPNCTVIIDGNNRYLAIKKFLSGDLILDESALTQLKFLANRRYDDLTENEKQYFNRNAVLKIFEYSSDKKILTSLEELEIQKYFYAIYNTGLRLEIEEIQKAEFSNDYITNKIIQDLNKDSNFYKMLEEMKLYNGRKKKNRIYNILLNCRVLIASTYSNIHNFSSTANLQTRIEENYLPNIHNLNKENIFKDFTLNINHIYSNLINTQKWKNYEILHSKPFIEATYWLISVMRKDKLGDPLKFDFMNYLEYFGEIEDKEKNFDALHAHYRKNIYHKYYIVAKYYEKVYGVNMDSYFREDTPKNDNIKSINNIEELHKRNFNFNFEKVQISTLLSDLQGASYNLRPYYQRLEVMNTTLSSRIIESILLGIRVPYILMCDKYTEGKLVTEVVDGQQRLLSLIGFLEAAFMNENKELELSNKNGYSLNNLLILHELNNHSFKKKKKTKKISLENINKILNSNLYVCRTKDIDDKSFNTIDYFVRLNKSASIIKENSYRMWSLIADRKIIEYANSISEEFMDNILPKDSRDGRANTITLRLAYLFYNNCEDINNSNYTNIKVSMWLKDFSKMKVHHMYKDKEKVEKIRIGYLNAIDETREFYNKLNLFLAKLNKSIRDLVAMNNFSHIPLRNYYYLFCLLKNIPNEDILREDLKIYNIVTSFFLNIKENKLDIDEIKNLLNFTIQQISIFDSSKKYEFKEKLVSALENK